MNSVLFFVFSLEENQIFAIELNTGDPNIKDYGQLFLFGIDSTGEELSDIGGPYSEFTKMLKKADGLPFDRVTLYQDGDLYRSWRFEQNSKGFTLSADTIKDGDDLQDRYGTNLVGLTDESLSLLSEHVLQGVIDRVREQLLE